MFFYCLGQSIARFCLKAGKLGKLEVQARFWCHGQNTLNNIETVFDATEQIDQCYRNGCCTFEDIGDNIVIYLSIHPV
jgi:hypothetical protein